MTAPAASTTAAFTPEWLAGLGLVPLPPLLASELLDHVCAAFELRVGADLARRLTGSQLDEVEAIMTAGDDEAVLAWLDSNVPSYRYDIAGQRERLEAELRAGAPRFLRALEAGRR